MRLRGPTVSLSVAAKADDALLAILLGQKELRQNEVVNGAEVIAGLRGSGLRLKRADAILAKAADAGQVIAIGRFRSKRYRLSPAGIDRAQQIARTLIAQAPQ
jgi:hypothetical protein